MRRAMSPIAKTSHKRSWLDQRRDAQADGLYPADIDLARSINVPATKAARFREPFAALASRPSRLAGQRRI